MSNVHNKYVENGRVSYGQAIRIQAAEIRIKFSVTELVP